MDRLAAHILDAIPTFVFVKNRAGRYTVVNGSHAVAYGRDEMRVTVATIAAAKASR